MFWCQYLRYKVHNFHKSSEWGGDYLQTQMQEQANKEGSKPSNFFALASQILKPRQTDTDMDVDGDTSKTKGGEDKRKPIVVMLVGAPGSGKSTFCEGVMLSSSRPWARVCQDTINNGKAGSKAQCLTSAAGALKEGRSVFIDRCNLDREQRAEFVKLAANSQVDLHCVVLDLPAQLCISRSVKRTGHEGNLQGGKAAAVVNRMLQKKELPKLNEGFSRIWFCQNENDVQAAITAYSALGPSGTLPNGCFGQKNQDAKVQIGIMRFLKKVEVPSNRETKSDGDHDPANNDEIKTCSKRPLDMSLASGCGANEVKEGEHMRQSSIGQDVSLNDIPTLAFPSISTADFQFNIEKASDIIIEKVEEFVKIHGNVRLVLVDLSHGSKILSLVRSKALQRKIDSTKFFTFVGDITRLYSRGGLCCNVIANATNWRLKPGGGGVNAAIFSAAGPSLEVATRERAKSILPGQAVVVPLPTDSPLYKREGVSHVIHVLGPNMNPQRPNCLNNDYTKGSKILRQAYTSIFEGFLSIARRQAKSRGENNETYQSEPSELEHPSCRGSEDHLENCDQRERDGEFISERSKKSKVSPDKIGTDAAVSSSTFGKVNKDHSRMDRSTSKSWGSWAQALYHIAMHPDRHKDEFLEISDEVVVLNDLYPKAKKHLLVLSRHEGLDQLADVRQEHVKMLTTMHAVGLKWAEKFLHEDPSMVFRLGYHSDPSMRQLHLHVVSQDFDSNHLKNKKHWNSFNTAFFRDSVDVIEEVKDLGKAILRDEDSQLSMELRCHRCRSAHPSIPKLKSHISNCRAPFPSHLLENGRLVPAQPRIKSDQ